MGILRNFYVNFSDDVPIRVLVICQMLGETRRRPFPPRAPPRFLPAVDSRPLSVFVRATLGEGSESLDGHPQHLARSAACFSTSAVHGLADPVSGMSLFPCT